MAETALVCGGSGARGSAIVHGLLVRGDRVISASFNGGAGAAAYAVSEAAVLRLTQVLSDELHERGRGSSAAPRLESIRHRVESTLAKNKTVKYDVNRRNRRVEGVGR